MGMLSGKHLAGALGLVLILLPTHGFGQSAPQALGLIATNGAVPLQCAGGECAAELSSFCLEPQRYAPKRGTQYSLGRNKNIKVVGVTRDGREVALDPATDLTVMSLRKQVAVRVTVKEATRRRHDLARVEISVDRNATLFPTDPPGGADEWSNQEKAILEGRLRDIGSNLVDQNEHRMVAARITSRIINTLPEANGGPEREKAWSEAVAAEGKNPMSRKAVDWARRAMDFCSFAVDEARDRSLRRCLRKEHDDFIGYLNSIYWKAIQTGT